MGPSPVAASAAFTSGRVSSLAYPAIVASRLIIPTGVFKAHMGIFAIWVLAVLYMGAVQRPFGLALLHSGDIKR